MRKVPEDDKLAKWKASLEQARNWPYKEKSKVSGNETGPAFRLLDRTTKSAARSLDVYNQGELGGKVQDGVELGNRKLLKAAIPENSTLFQKRKRGDRKQQRTTGIITVLFKSFTEEEVENSVSDGVWGSPSIKTER